jgi:hypothetical protein
VTERQSDSQAARLTDGLIKDRDRQTERQTDRKKDRQTEREKDIE